MVVLESRERDFAIPLHVVEVDDSGAIAERSGRGGRTFPPQASEAVRRRMPGFVHVSVRESPRGFTARCVEFDIVGEGDTEQEAIHSVFVLLRGYVLAAIELDEAEHLIPPPAPERRALSLNAHEATRRIRRRLSPPPSTANAENILARFGACNSRAEGSATWERPFPGGGTRCVPVPRDRVLLARERRLARSSGTVAFTRMTGGEPRQTGTGPHRSVAARTRSGLQMPRSPPCCPCTRPESNSCARARERRVTRPRSCLPSWIACATESRPGTRRTVGYGS